MPIYSLAFVQDSRCWECSIQCSLVRYEKWHKITGGYQSSSLRYESVALKMKKNRVLILTRVSKNLRTSKITFDKTASSLLVILSHNWPTLGKATKWRRRTLHGALIYYLANHGSMFINLKPPWCEKHQCGVIRTCTKPPLSIRTGDNHNYTTIKYPYSDI